MNRKIKSIQDVVDWGLCVGCGACATVCNQQAIRLEHYPKIGIRPVVDSEACGMDCQCLSVCPGYSVDGHQETGSSLAPPASDRQFGPVLEIWEGHAADPNIRHAASSGGGISALASYCLENEPFQSVLHVGMDPETPYRNKTYISKTPGEVLERSGSRYAPAAPCEGISQLSQDDTPCVFIGKPCDAAAAAYIRKHDPVSGPKIGLVLTFFCAGTPSTEGTLNLLKLLGADSQQLNHLRYRGNGWPGYFKATHTDSNLKPLKSNYETSWGNLQRYRPFRCHLCPDGLGQVADISCGDAWHQYAKNGNPGLSLFLIRTEKGRKIFHRAVQSGYLTVKPANMSEVLLAQQNLLERRTHIWGRLLAMRLLGIPIPVLKGFALFKNWRRLPFPTQFRTVFGTLRRLIQRHLWRKQPVSR